MEHSFDVDLAAEIGIKEAVIFKNIAYWIQKNEANGKHFYDGNTWTYNSVKAFSEIFFYMSPKEIRNALAKLESCGLIESGNYNKLKLDRTKWYALTEQGKAICQKVQIHLPKSTNGDDPEGKAIPDKNTADNPNDKHNNAQIKFDVEGFFNKMWRLYPRKEGKGKVSAKQKCVLFKLGEDQITRCIERYIKHINDDGIEKRFIMHGSTFFNSGYEDYLDENYDNVESSSDANVNAECRQAGGRQ